MKDYVDLGIMNSWGEAPKEFEKCRNKQHELEVVKKGRCWNKYICHKCKIFYEVDSSD